MKIIALSDMHYKFCPANDAERQVNAYGHSFLSSLVGKIDILVLNGDIFDLWFDWEYAIIPQYFPILKVLAEIHEAGARIIYISGNHDFWFGCFLSQYLGIELYSDSYELKADGKRLYLTHGDLYTVNDMRYKLFRYLIRLPQMRALFSLLHPNLALRLGALLSRSSRKRKDPTNLRARKVAGLKRHATAMIKNGYDIVIMGHSHEPELCQMGSGFYANCGDWIRHQSYLQITDGIPVLSKFEPVPK